MSGVRINNQPPLWRAVTLNIRAEASEAGKRLPALSTALGKIQDTFNSVIGQLSTWQIGDVTRLDITDRTGKSIGWVGVNGKAEGAALNSFRAYSDGAHLGTGRLTAPAQISGAATNLLTVGTDDQIQVLDFAAGGGAYTYNIDLDTVAAFEGAVFYLKVTKAASTNPTIVVRNGSGGSSLVSLNNANAENYGGVFVFDGTNWNKIIFAKNDL